MLVEDVGGPAGTPALNSCVEIVVVVVYWIFLPPTGVQIVAVKLLPALGDATLQTETIVVGLLVVAQVVLSGGEPAALALLDGIARLLPGVTGDPESTVLESFEDDLLEAPHYTRPREFRGMAVPEVLLSGDHAAIALWRREQSLLITQERRADLLQARAARHAATEGKPWIE